MANSFGSFYADASGGEGDRCKYPTRLDTYSTIVQKEDYDEADA